jgi:sugar diacid utilization regulator
MAVRPELQEIADEASRILDADVTVEDREFTLVAFGTQREDVDAIRLESILRRHSTSQVRTWFEQFGIASSPRPIRTPADADAGIRSRLCVPARWRGVTYGYIWAIQDTMTVDDPAVVLVEQLAEHAAAYLAQFNRQREDDSLAVTDLLSSDADTVRRSTFRVVDRGLIARRTPVVAVVVGGWGASDTGNALIPNLWALPRTVLADSGHNSTTLLVPLRSTEDLTPARDAAELTLKLYSDVLPLDWDGQLVAGVGDPRLDIGTVRDSWLEARLAARVAAAVPAVRPVARWAGLGVYRLLAALPDPDLAKLLLDAPVRRLLDSPDLADTVRCYLDRAGNVAQTAAALHIHRQTLYSRLGKAEQLTGLSLESGHDRLRLHLGLIIVPLLNEQDG